MVDTAIRTEGLSKRFAAVEALVGLDLEVARGEVVGYLGPNGAGKTTTIRLLLDLARPSGGRAEIFGLDTQRQAVEVHRRVVQHCVLEAKSRGQTVLLSSHILSEVETVCDRVAILRRGRLVETGTLAELRHLAAVSVDAVLNARPPDLSRVPGVSQLRVDGCRLQCQMLGSVDPLLRALTEIGVKKLLIREPSLEELFLAHYGIDGVVSGDGMRAGAG